MIVEHLSLVDFRNYATAELTLHRGPNVLVGRNGQGKTNLAEAIVFLATLGSHRVSSDAPMVRDGQEFAVIRARLSHGERRVLAEVQVNRQGSNKARINGSPSKPNELPRYAHVVLFAPEDLQIVRGDPSARRRFTDQLLIQRTPRLAAVLADYDRVLKQRNALLKSARARGVRGEGLSTLDVWDDKLVSLGSEIITARQRLAADLRSRLPMPTRRSPVPIIVRNWSGRSPSAAATPKKEKTVAKEPTAHRPSTDSAIRTVSPISSARRSQRSGRTSLIAG